MSLEVILVIVVVALAAGALGFFLARRPTSPLASFPALDPRVEQALQALPGLQQELGGLKQSIARLPSNDVVTALRDRVGRMEGRLPDDLGGSVGRMQDTLTRLETEFKTRKQFEDRNRAAIEKIEAVLVGAQSRGAAGEEVLAEALSQFPADMAETQFKVGGRVVEFALVLPNNKRLPIDSKWPAARELEQYAAATEEKERQELLGRIEKAVLKKVDEVTKYIEPGSTATFAVAAIPDAAYFACRTAHLDAYKQRVLLMPYSLTIPFLLALYNLHLQFARSIDQENLEAYISQFEALVNQLEEKLDNSVQRGTVMITNAYLEMKERISQMRGTLSTLRSLPTEMLAEKQESLLKD
ncbi:MAG: DNA recombination protein RmuC [Candidatus Acidiferrales bacterium]